MKEKEKEIDSDIAEMLESVESKEKEHIPLMKQIMNILAPIYKKTSK